MKFDFQLLFVLILIGMFSKKIDAKGWVALVILISTWMRYNWYKQ